MDVERGAAVWHSAAPLKREGISEEPTELRACSIAVFSSQIGVGGLAKSSYNYVFITLCHARWLVYQKIISLAHTNKEILFLFLQ